MFSRCPKVSIITNNYNYGRFLKQAIDSAINQTIKAYEIIIVDDGSTDNSREYIEEYRDKAILILKENGGQASAFNAGFEASSGDWIWFLDADDWLEKNALQTLPESCTRNISKIHGPLHAVDESGNSLDFFMPPKPLSEGNVIPEIVTEGGYCWPPTSGNIFPRWVLEQCMPMPEEDYRLCADLYVCNQAAMLGEMYVLKDPVGSYRIHAVNNYYGYRMDSGWFKRQADSLLTGARLIEELVRKYRNDPSFQYPYSRRSVEMLMTAYRFANLKSNGQFSKRVLHQKWWRSSEIRTISGISKLKGVVFWIFLSYAPKAVASSIINYQHKKARRFLEKNFLLTSLGISLVNSQ